MNRQLFKIISGAGFCAMVLLGSCAEEVETRRMADADNTFSFTVETAPWGGQDSIATVEADSNLPEGKMPVTAVMGTEMDADRTTADNDSLDSRQGTRGVVKTSFDKNTDGFQVACYRTNVENDNTAGVKLYFNERVSWNSTNGKWQTTKTDYTWRKSPNMLFYAWWPADVAFDTSTKVITYSLTKPEDDDVSANKYVAEQQTDLLYAYTGFTGSNEKADAKLTFKHALTAIQICSSPNAVVKDDNITIKRITFKNVGYKGRFDLTTGQWTCDDTRAADLVNFSVRPTVETPRDNYNIPINSGDKTFYMIPQSLSSKVEGLKKQVEIVFTRGSDPKENIMVASLDGLPDWEAGQTVKYVLGKQSPDSYILYASAAPVDYNKTSIVLKVNSYLLTKSATDDSKMVKNKVGWKVDGVSIDGGQTFNAVDATEWTGRGMESVTPWLTNLSSIKDNSQSTTENDYSEKSISMACLVTEPTVLDSREDVITAQLREAEPVSDLDLSMYDAHGTPLSASCTANCYVVSAAGTYKFPAVYGNGLVNGVVNENCIATNFRNYDDVGTVPTSVYIYRDKLADGTTITPVDAVVSWYGFARYNYSDRQYKYNDLGCPVKNLSYSDGYVHFEVGPKNNLIAGNVVIALRDASQKVIWSWHIWITTAMKYDDAEKNPAKDYVYTNADGVKKHLAPCHLGQMFLGGSLNYENKAVVLRLVQTDASGTVLPLGATTKVVVEKKSNYIDGRYVRSLYYSWGRKDPAPVRFDRLNHVGYDTNGFTIKPNIQSSIQHPNWFLYQSWNSFINNLWTIDGKMGNESNLKVIKTIYDPCPYPYHVPGVRTFNADIFNTVSVGVNQSYSIPMNSSEYSYSTTTGNIGLGCLTISKADENGHSNMKIYYSGYYESSGAFGGYQYGRFFLAHCQTTNKLFYADFKTQEYIRPLQYSDLASAAFYIWPSYDEGEY